MNHCYVISILVQNTDTSPSQDVAHRLTEIFSQKAGEYDLTEYGFQKAGPTEAHPYFGDLSCGTKY